MRLDLTCCTSLVVTCHAESERNSVSSQRFIYHGSGADSVCKLNEVNRFISTMQHQFTTVMEGLDQAELSHGSRQQAANEIAALEYEMRDPQRGPQTTGVGVDPRLLGKTRWFLGCSGCLAGLARSFRGVRWRSGA